MASMVDDPAGTQQGQALPGMPTPDRQRPRWSAAEAARRCGVGRATIQRALEDGRIIDAQKTEDGWQIPVESLLAAGFKPTAEPAPQTPDTPLTEDARDHDRAPVAGAHVAELQAQITALTANLDTERARREQAEQDARHAREIAAERGRSLEDLRTAIRLLEPPKPATNQAPAPSWTSVEPTTDQAGARTVRRWLGRGRR